MNKIVRIVQNVWHKNASNVCPIKNGIISETYSFSVGKNNYVIRISSSRTTYDKDMFAFENFTSGSLKMPKILKVGTYNKKYFAISERLSGRTLDTFSDKQQIEAVKKVLKIHLKIAQLTLKAKSRFGFWKGNGLANFSRWDKYLFNIEREINNKLKSDKNVQIILARLRKLLRFVPDKHMLIHGDFGFNNLLYDGRQITGVLDWSDSKYGDSLYDIAYLIFWASEIDYLNISKKFYKENKLSTKNFNKRINCYLCHIALTTMSYFNLKGDKKNYLWVVKKLNRSFV